MSEWIEVPLTGEFGRGDELAVRANPDEGGFGLLRAVDLLTASPDVMPDDLGHITVTILTPLDARNLAAALLRAADELERIETEGDR